MAALLSGHSYDFVDRFEQGKKRDFLRRQALFNSQMMEELSKKQTKWISLLSLLKEKQKVMRSRACNPSRDSNPQSQDSL